MYKFYLHVYSPPHVYVGLLRTAVNTQSDTMYEHNKLKGLLHVYTIRLNMSPPGLCLVTYTERMTSYMYYTQYKTQYATSRPVYT